MTIKSLVQILGATFPATDKVVAGIVYGPYNTLTGTLSLEDPDNPGTGIIKRMRNRHAIVWPVTGHDIEGAPMYGEPFDVMCRWTDVRQMFRTATGEERMSMAVVYPSVDVQAGSLMKEGRVVGLLSTNHLDNDHVFTVGANTVLHKLRNNGTLYKVHLI